jgi:hypothetical protein
MPLTFVRLRYSLGGNRPSQTNHYQMSFFIFYFFKTELAEIQFKNEISHLFRYLLHLPKQISYKFLIYSPYKIESPQ